MSINDVQTPVDDDDTINSKVKIIRSPIQSIHETSLLQSDRLLIVPRVLYTSPLCSEFYEIFVVSPKQDRTFVVNVKEGQFSFITKTTDSEYARFSHSAVSQVHFFPPRSDVQPSYLDYRDDTVWVVYTKSLSVMADLVEQLQIQGFAVVDRILNFPEDHQQTVYRQDKTFTTNGGQQSLKCQSLRLIAKVPFQVESRTRYGFDGHSGLPPNDLALIPERIPAPVTEYQRLVTLEKEQKGDYFSNNTFLESPAIQLHFGTDGFCNFRNVVAIHVVRGDTVFESKPELFEIPCGDQRIEDIVFFSSYTASAYYGQTFATPIDASLPMEYDSIYVTKDSRRGFHNRMEEWWGLKFPLSFPSTLPSDPIVCQSFALEPENTRPSAGVISMGERTDPE